MGTVCEDQYTFFIISCLILRKKNNSDKNCRENQTSHFMPSNFFWKSCHLWDNVEKHCRVGQAPDNNMAHVLCMLDTW